MLGRLSIAGEILTGEVPKSAIKILSKLRKIGGLGVGIAMELGFPDDADAVEDMLPPINAYG